MSGTLHYDLIIVGGGLIGCSLALGLAKTRVRIAIIEAFEKKNQHHSQYDVRSMVLSHGSLDILKQFDLREALYSQLTPIKKIHISNKGSFGFNRIDASEEGVSELGAVIETPTLGHLLKDAALKFSNVDLLCPATVKQFKKNRLGYCLEVVGETVQRLTTELFVVADGAHSSLRQALGIQVETTDYQQTAIVANVGLKRPHQFVAYERFTETGPLALLPMKGRRMAMVWTANASEVNAWMSMDEDAFLAALQKRFGYRLGAFSWLGKRQTFPLKLMVVKEQVRPGLVLVGNAAHSVHPVAGQGFNLGLRDVKALVDLIHDANHQKKGSVVCSFALLNHYQAQRDADQQRVIHYTDGLIRYFSNKNPMYSLTRNTGLIIFDLIRPLKSKLVQQNMGLF